jgi:hypothetical protein
MLSKKNRDKVELALKTMLLADPSGNSHKLWQKRFSKMGDTEFAKFIENIKSGKETMALYTANLINPLRYENLEKAGEFLGISFYHRLIMTDEDTGVQFVTKGSFFITEQSVRRLQQTLEESISVPRSDTKIDASTGQVIGDDRAAAYTYPEMQIDYGRGYDTAIRETAVIRGGNIHAYALFRQQLEDTGAANVDDSIPKDSVARSVQVLDAYLIAMGYRTNLVTKTELKKPDAS